MLIVPPTVFPCILVETRRVCLSSMGSVDRGTAYGPNTELCNRAKEVGEFVTLGSFH